MKSVSEKHKGMEMNQEQAQSSEQQPAPTPQENTQSDVRSMLSQLEAFLDEYMVKKAPFHLPGGLKEFIVTISPYLIIISAILMLPVIALALGLGALFAPFALLSGWHMGGLGVLSVITGIASLVVEIIALPGLFKRTHKGWRLVFYASLIGLVGNMLTLNIIGGIIGAIISWYILFQVKELYKN